MWMEKSQQEAESMKRNFLLSLLNSFTVSKDDTFNMLLMFTLSRSLFVCIAIGNIQQG